MREGREGKGRNLTMRLSPRLAEILQKKDADVPRQTAPARAELLLQGE